MKIYTKTGDKGDTGLFGGARVSKADRRVAAYGDIDELNSVIGLARAELGAGDLDSLLARIQSELFTCGSELGCVPGKAAKLPTALLDEVQVVALEQAIDSLESELAPLTNFILPGGSRAAAALHLARTVCRRAERHIVALADDEPVRAEIVRYVNRLSDLLFTAARVANARASVADVLWQPRTKAETGSES
ncbi:MAG: cob(I)yrinic acid a,c-diamide adenosyltransferase [Polyangiales bacterium]